MGITIKRSERPSSPVGFYSLLGLLFVGLRLTDYIDWPWVWVLAPFWAPLVLFLVAVATLGLVVFIAEGGPLTRRQAKALEGLKRGR